MARAALLLHALLGVAGAVELSSETWEEATAGKTVFVKYFAPWCGHCKALKPAWDKLMAEFEDSKALLVADVDCISDGKELCEEVGVQGFPTLKYGDPSDLQDYEGSRDFDDLKAFAGGLGPLCSAENLDLCDDEKKKQIQEYQGLSSEAREAKIQEMQGGIEKLESDFKEFVEGLEKSYEEESSKKDKAIAAVKAAGLGLLKSVHKSMTKDKDEF